MTFLCSFASNPVTHNTLRQYDAIPTLITIMRSKLENVPFFFLSLTSLIFIFSDPEFIPTSAALAVANLCHHEGDFAALEAGCSPD